MDGIVYYNIARPWQPLPSDRTVLWLASTYAAAGCTVRPVARPELAGEDCALLLTNRASRTAGDRFPVLEIGCDGDLRDRIKLGLGRFYGMTPGYQRSGKQGLLMRSLLRPARLLLARRRSVAGALAAEQLEPETGLAGRRVVLRVNVDWDARGLEILERWYEHYEISATLAVAGTEVDPVRERFSRFVSATGCDIASHTWSHFVVLSSRGRARQRREIAENHDYLQQLTGRRVRGFVAPYVKYDRHTLELLEEAGYDWFIRDWLLHPLRLQGSRLTDLGISFHFNRGWQNTLLARLAQSDLVLQLHLPDLVRFEHLLEHNLRSILQRGARIIDCDTYLRETMENGR